MTIQEKDSSDNGTLVIIESGDFVAPIGQVQKDLSLSVNERTLAEQRLEAEEMSARRKEANDKLLTSSTKPKARTRLAAGTDAPADISILAAAAFTLSNILPDVDDARQNTVPAAAWEDADSSGNSLITITVPRWASTVSDTEAPDYAGTNDVIYFGRQDRNNPANNIRYGDFLFSTPFELTTATSPTEYTFTLTPDFIRWLDPDRLNNIFYIVTNEIVLNDAMSPLQPLFVDATPPSFRSTPGPLGIPTTPAGITAPVVLTRALLESNQLIEFPVPLATGAWPGDRIVVRAGGVIVHEAVMWPIDDQAQPLPLPAPAPNATVAIPSIALLALGEGPKELEYELIDRAGWGSGRSQSLQVTLRLDAVPGVLPAPVITAARVDRVIARTGLPIRVPDITNAQPGDLIEMRLIRPIAANPPGDTGNVVTLPTFTYGSNPRTVIASWDDLAVPRLGGQSFYDLNVEYTLRRGTADLGISPRAIVPLDLRTVGPVPIDQGPVNTALTPVVVRGPASQTDNLIDSRDTGQDGVITFTYYEGLAAGHVVRFFYDGGTAADQVAELELVGNETVGTTVTVALPEAVITARGNGRKPIYYEVYADDTAANANNFQRSPTTDVRVQFVTLALTSFIRYTAVADTRVANGQVIQQQNRRPGSPVTQTGIINCGAQPWLGINLEIFEPTLVVGDIVTITLTYSSNALGTALVNQHYTFDHDVTQADVNDRRLLHSVPYSQIMFYNVGSGPTPALASGSFVSSFTVTKADGGFGSTADCLVRYSRLQTNTVCGPAL